MEGQTALIGEIDSQTDASAESLFHQPRSIVDQCSSAAEMSDEMHSDFSGAVLLHKDSDRFLSTKELIHEISDGQKLASCVAVECCDYRQAPASLGDRCLPFKALASHSSSYFSSDGKNHPLVQYSTSDGVVDKAITSDNADCNVSLAGCTVGSCKSGDIGGSTESKSDGHSARRRNPKRAASLKKMCSIDQLDRHAGKKHVKSSGKLARFSSFIWDSLKKATKKRSFRNNNRASDWGTVENLYKIFKQDDGCLIQISQVVLPGRSPRLSVSSSKGRRKEPKTMKKSKNSRKKSVTSKISCLDGPSNSHFPDLIDISFSTRGIPGNCMLGNDHDNALSHSCLDDSTTLRKGNLLQSGREPGSTVTEEVSGENNSSDLHGISSQVIPQSFQDIIEDILPIYPGTSPESDVIHPTTDVGSVASEIVTSSDHEPSGGGFINENADGAESNVLNKMLTAPCILPIGSSSVSSLVLEQFPTHTKDITVIRNDSRTLLFTETCSLMEKANRLSLDETRRVATGKKCEQKTDESNFLKCYNRKTYKKPSDNASDLELLAGESGEAVNLLSHPENFHGRLIEKSAMSSGAGGDIIRNAEAGESKYKAPNRKYNAKSQNKKDKSLMDKGNIKVLLNTASFVQETHIYNAVGKEDDLPSSGCLVMDNACSLGRVAEAVSNTGLQHAQMKLTKLGTNGENVLDCGVSTIGNTLGSEVSHSYERSEMQNFAGQGLEALCLQEAAWVCCDVCSKWRSIPEKLADRIEETHCRWTCNDNDDKRFADCSIPQEKSNSEINAELGIPDEELVYDQNINLPENKRASWIGIRSNLYLHRSRRKQTIDEIMVCHCKPPLDGSQGCRDECLNRMLNIECVRGTCPCGDLCSNQQFQKRKYTKMKWFHSGNKGHGLKSLENISEGDFLIEYVGEVLDMATYEARQREYALRGQEHFYFMTLNSHEVIDACSKGNLGRFINHSCEPNCRTEKWMVKGEVCIGLFALRDIKKGEEITFDYNYVRVVGAAAKKCYCGSANCRGFIGGDPLNNERIADCGLDEEYRGSLMVGYDSAVEHGLEQRVSHPTNITLLTEKDGMRGLNLENEVSKATLVTYQMHDDTSLCIKDTIDSSLFIKSASESPLPIEHSCKPSPVQPSVVGVKSMRKCIVGTSLDNETEILSADLSSEIGLDNKMGAVSPDTSTGTSLDNRTIALTDTITTTALDSKIMAATNTSEYKMATVKFRPPKFPHPGGITKLSASSKPSMPQKLKKNSGSDSNCQFEGVEEKLNVLLDSEGGISKRKDSGKGYLKLLVVTAASNNADNEATQSTRDLSLILDALLKTKSRSVLTDIINKNGLQMLHNILKQNRGSTIKIPILRKLLKVLEFLATKGILSVEQINMDPSHVGVESFRDSILDLTYHSDIQVHMIARNFRDRWIPRAYRRTSQLYKDRYRLDSPNENSGSLLPCKRQVEHSVKDADDTGFQIKKRHVSSVSTGRHGSPDGCLTYPKVSDPVEEGGHSEVIVTRIRKRKSRWDQDKPPDKKSFESIASVAWVDSAGKADMKFIQTAEASVSRYGVASSCQQGIDDEAPPGFEPHSRLVDDVAVETPSTSDRVVVGQLQERYMAQLTVSHGIPFTLMQQLGTPADAIGGVGHCWTVAPGMPFHPFPPLPTYARAGLMDCSSSSLATCGNVRPWSVASGAIDRCRLNGQFISSNQCNPSVPRISGEAQIMFSEKGLVNTHYTESSRKPGSGRFSFRSERGNNRGYQRFGSPCGRARNHQLKFNSRCGTQARIFENIRRKNGRCFDPNGVRGEDLGSTFHQQANDS